MLESIVTKIIIFTAGMFAGLIIGLNTEDN